MSNQSIRPGSFSKRRFISLRYRFILITSFLLILLVGTLGTILITHQSHSIREQLERRGLAIAGSLAATSKASLATYNYIALEQAVNQTRKDDPDLEYVIIHDKEGRVAGYSGRADLQGISLDDPVSAKAISAAEPVTQTAVSAKDGAPVMEMAVPVFIPGSDHRWGTIRVAVALEPMYQQTRQTQFIIVGIGLVALMFGVMLSIYAARRITRPLGTLVKATVEAARGNLSQNIEVETGDEVEILASNFSTMMREILVQKQQLEQQLSEIRRLQLYTEKLLTTMSDGLLSVDTTGNIAAVNPAARRMLGMSGERQRESSASMNLRHFPELVTYIEDVLRDPGVGAQQELRINRDGEEQILLANSSLLKDGGGKALEVITNLHDVTELKRLEAHVRQTERLAALGTLAAGMAHEIRNPLSAIKTFVQLLPRKVAKAEFLEKFQRTVPRELERINRLIEDLLELSRTPRYRFEFLDLQALLQQTVEFFEGELHTSGIDCITRFSSDLPLISGDPDQLVKAFYNLFRNAIQAMPNGGRLTVTARREANAFPEGPAASGQDGWVCLSFADSGVGIPEDAAKNIFNPFFTTKDRGTGLGLAITHKVISEHGGRIDVSSRVGEGSCFSILLPAWGKRGRELLR